MIADIFSRTMHAEIQFFFFFMCIFKPLFSKNVIFDNENEIHFLKTYDFNRETLKIQQR